MTDLFSFLPKDKSECSGIEHLRHLSDQEIEPVIQPLLEWIQDMNWPVAPKAVKILSLHQSLTEPYLVDLLRAEQEDEIWKYWILTALLPHFEVPVTCELKQAVSRISEYPTAAESEEDVHLAAREYLESLN